MRHTKVWSVSFLLEPTINALAAKLILFPPCSQKPLWYDQEQDQVVDNRSESSGSTDERASLKDFKHGPEPPMPLLVAKTVEWLSKGQIADQIKH